MLFRACVCFFAICAAALGAAENLVPSFDQWKLEGVTWQGEGAARELTTTMRYAPVRIVSPAVPVKDGELFTASVPLATHFKTKNFQQFYRAWVELEFLAGNKPVKRVRSSEQMGTQPTADFGVTAVTPADAQSVRVAVYLMNRFWSAVENGARPGTPQLQRIAGPAGTNLSLAVAEPFSAPGAERKATVLIRGDWPNGTAVSLQSDGGHASPTALFRDGGASASVSARTDEFGPVHLNASIDGRRLGSVEIPDPHAGGLRLSATADNAPVQIELTRDGKPLPGRYPATPSFHTQAPWETALAPGRWRVRLLRGPHFEPVVQEVEVRPGETTELSSARPERAVALNREGWYSGDADGDVYHGERIYTDMDVKTAVTVGRARGMEWLGAGNWGPPDIKTSLMPFHETWAQIDKETKALSTPDMSFAWTDEQPKNKDGHGCFIGLRRPPEENHEDFLLRIRRLRNFEIVGALRASGAATFMNHPLRWWITGGKFNTNMYSALPFDVAVAGVFDGLNLTDGGEKVLQLWSMLLDHGFRLAATGGADFGLDRPTGPLPGELRLYVHSPSGRAPEAIAAGIRRGHTVVSTSPMLLADIQGALPGSSVAAGKLHRVRARAWARRDVEDPLTAIELWAHGKVLESRPATDPLADETVFAWEPKGDWDWVAVRARSKRGWAMTSAFFAASTKHVERKPVVSKVSVRISGLSEAEIAAATLETWDAWPDSPVARKIATRPLSDSRSFEAPATATLVARAGSGREVRARLYDAAGIDGVVKTIAAGERQIEPLLEWETYEDVLKRMEHVSVTLKF